MTDIANLLTEHMAIWTAAESEKKSGRGRASGNAGIVYGVKKLRELILELAVRGKLAAQDADDEPASQLLKRIQAEKAILIAEGKLKKEKSLAPIGEDEKPFELPNDWEWVRLGFITNFGLTEKLYKITNDTWVLDLEDIEKDTSVILQKNRFSEKQSLSDKNSFKKGDVLYGKLRPYLNKVVVADEDGVCTTEILPIRCYGDFDNKYFMYALKAPHFIAYVNARSYGMKMPRLGTDDGRNSLFPLAPIAEQHRIVAKVDELMALCDQLEQQHSTAQEAHETLVSQLLATLTHPTVRPELVEGRGSTGSPRTEFEENWQRIYAHFDVLFTTEASIDALKQTLLQLAVMGKLVPQNPNDEPASELLKRIQAEKAKLIAEGKLKKEKPLAPITEDEKPFELPKGWEWARISYLNPEFQNGVSSRGDAGGVSIIVLRLADINDREISLEDPRELSISSDVIDRYRLNAGDILIVRVNGSADLVGGFVLSDREINAIYCDHFIRMRISHNYINPNFLSLVGDSSLVRERIKEMFITTAGQKTVNQNHISSLVIPLIPLTEQHRIVAKVDELMALCDQLKACIQQANQQQQAIADALVAQAVA